MERSGLPDSLSEELLGELAECNGGSGRLLDRSCCAGLPGGVQTGCADPDDASCTSGTVCRAWLLSKDEATVSLASMANLDGTTKLSELDHVCDELRAMPCEDSCDNDDVVEASSC
jgi:hypothetical protein